MIFILYHLPWLAWLEQEFNWKNLSKQELIEELFSAEDISFKLSDLTSHIDDFLRRYEIPFSELSVTKNCNYLLNERIVQLERNAVNNA